MLRRIKHCGISKEAECQEEDMQAPILEFIEVLVDAPILEPGTALILVTECIPSPHLNKK